MRSASLPPNAPLVAVLRVELRAVGEGAWVDWGIESIEGVDHADVLVIVADALLVEAAALESGRRSFRLIEGGADG